MKIALLGYGKMGKEIEKIALSRKHTIVLTVDKDNATAVTPLELQQADVAIEFSTPHTVVDNIYKCFSSGIPVVVGTTGWHETFNSISEDCKKGDHTLFHATNFSLGVNIFFKLNAYLATIMNNFPDYEVSMEEIHHIHKLDKPSGTAITLAEQILQRVDRKSSWSLNKEAGSESLYIQDIRSGEVPGTHMVKYTSAIDDIEIMHKAHNRTGFALGAVLAAEFIQHRKGVYTMNDLLKF